MRILVTDGMDKTAMELLRSEGHEVVEQFYAPEELGKALREFDACVVRSKTKVRAAQIDEAKGSSLSSSFAAASASTTSTWTMPKKPASRS